MKHKSQKIKTENIKAKKTFLERMFHVSRFTFHEKGFTLLESLVAIAILTTGVSASIYLVIQAIQTGDRVQKLIVAAHLAQEGIEVIRNIRDDNWLSGSNWTQSIDTGGVAGCVDYNDTVVEGIDTSCLSGQYLLFNDGRYAYDDSQSSNFSRTASTTLIASDKLLVEVNVACGRNCNVKLEEYLYNWK